MPVHKIYDGCETALYNCSWSREELIGQQVEICPRISSIDLMTTEIEAFVRGKSSFWGNFPQESVFPPKPEIVITPQTHGWDCGDCPARGTFRTSGNGLDLDK